MAKVSYWELINIVGNTKVEEFEKILSFIYIATKYVNQFFDVSLVEKLALMIGVDFLKDFALGRADLDEDALPKDVQELISIG
jgi:hypothetical protein